MGGRFHRTGAFNPCLRMWMRSRLTRPIDVFHSQLEAAKQLLADFKENKVPQGTSDAQVCVATSCCDLRSYCGRTSSAVIPCAHCKSKPNGLLGRWDRG